MEITAASHPFLHGYLICALWSSSVDGSGESFLDQNYDIEDLSPEFLKEAEEDCRDFQHDQKLPLMQYLAAGRTLGDAGHDFWLTRCGHGAGFWDRGLGDLGDRLSDACDPYGNVDLYLGDDGMIYGG